MIVNTIVLIVNTTAMRIVVNMIVLKIVVVIIVAVHYINCKKAVFS